MASLVVLDGFKMMLPTEDLKHIAELVKPFWAEMKGQSVFVSGGTGFVGSWLIESFLYANKEFSLGAQMAVLSRDPSLYLAKHPQLKSESSLVFIQGDVRGFADPAGDFDYVIHAATEPSAALDAQKYIQTLDVSYSGTKRVLEFCKSKKVKKFLFVSSGAVYGKQPQNMRHVDESFIGVLNPAEKAFAYGEGKRVGEWLSLRYAEAYGFEVTIARCFAFVGPYLPLDGHYAVGNFIRNVLAGDNIKIQSDGLAKRSYMYASDLTVWLWRILMQGKNLNAYNVGSENAVSIKELAEKIVSIENPALKVLVQGASSGNLSGDLYVPSTQKARHELQLKMVIGEDQAMQKTLDFYKKIKEAR